MSNNECLDESEHRVVECALSFNSYYDWKMSNMRLSALFIPIFTVLAGVFGFYLRLSEQANVFNSITGLPARGAATTLWLVTLSIVVLTVLLILAIRIALRHKALPGFESAFGTDPLIYPILFVLIGIVWLIGTYMYFSDLNAANAITIIDIIFLAFSAISAISVTFFAIEMYQDSRRSAPYALSVAPTLFMCFWLIFIYRQNASNPVLLSYIYQCLAVVFSALGFYFTSGFLYGKPAPGRATITYYASVFFCLITLADNHPTGIKVIFFALSAINLIYATMLLLNLQSKKDADMWETGYSEQQ